MHDSDFFRMQGPNRAMPERTSKDREFKNAVVCMCLGQKDLHIHQERSRRDRGRVEKQIDHLITMVEGEMRRGLCERREECICKQRGQNKPMEIKRSSNRKHRIRKFKGANPKRRGQRNTHTCEKASCDYIMEEFKYNRMGLARHMTYEEFLHMAS